MESKVIQQAADPVNGELVTVYRMVLLRGSDSDGAGWYVNTVVLDHKGKEIDLEEPVDSNVPEYIVFFSREEAAKKLKEIRNYDFYRGAWWFDSIMKKHGNIYQIQKIEGYLKDDELFIVKVVDGMY